MIQPELDSASSQQTSLSTPPSRETSPSCEGSSNEQDKASVLLSKTFSFIHKEPVLCVAFVAAIVSFACARDAQAVAQAIDTTTLALLFCFMTCVAGLSKAGVFQRLAQTLVERVKSAFLMSALLVALPFFCSMFITNDVSLILFVPFTLLLLHETGDDARIAPILVLQTIGANMGSIVTPFGNPQNLYLYSYFDLSLGDFFSVLAPFALLSAALLLIGCFVWNVGRKAERRTGQPNGEASPLADLTCTFASGRHTPSTTPTNQEVPGCFDKRLAILYGALFMLAVLSVIKVVPTVVSFVVILVVTVFFFRAILKDVNWFLLATFVCFFVFSGSLSAIEPVNTFLTNAMSAQPFFISLGASQVISNVPAAVLLAPFTTDWAQLLLGVDIGGLGTPVASLASLITLSSYQKESGQKLGRFMKYFLLLNAAVLVCNVGLWALASL